ncbi:MAG: aminodeoxychorismate synthase component I [Gammaproteobacteria bacterium]|nr:aminodeoxychorismate synthase component I [Gammaproteobacteria bacterium]
MSTPRPEGLAARTPLLRELEVSPAVLRRLAASDPVRYPLLLDSAAAGPLGRASVLLAEPRAALWLTPDGKLRATGFIPRGTGFLEALEHWWLDERTDGPIGHPAFSGSDGRQIPSLAGGWALFLGYEIGAETEPALALPRAPLPCQAFALRTRGALVHELAGGGVYAMAEEDAQDALARIVDDARAAASRDEPCEALEIATVREEPAEAYLGRVRRAKEYVAAGDIYQANLSRPWDVYLAAGRPSEASLAATLYRRLCAANPAPFAALAQWRGLAILSSSPERLLRVSGRRVDTRPIAGTHPRSRRPAEDLREMSELAAHPKERAEHIMLIDLERNDLGRVCEAGSVRVDELMTIESYAHVHHIVSNVTGVLRSEVTPIGALRAVFPGGTITGCPKFRCMQIIAELECEGRGAYTGSLGYLTPDGRLDLNILIRTMTLQGRHLSFRAGAGIVADSDPQRELEETRAKARGLLAALGGAP